MDEIGFPARPDRKILGNPGLVFRIPDPSEYSSTITERLVYLSSFFLLICIRYRHLSKSWIFMHL